MKKKIVIIAAAALAVAVAAGGAFFFLRGGAEHKIKSPEAYVIGEERTRPLDQFFGENSALVSVIEATRETENGEAAEPAPEQQPAGAGILRHKNMDKTGQKPPEPAAESPAEVAAEPPEPAEPTAGAANEGLSIKERQKAEKKARQEAEKAAKAAEKEAAKEAKKAAKEAEKAAKNRDSSFNAKTASKGVANPHAGERLAALLPEPQPGAPDTSEEVKATEAAAVYDQVIIYTYSEIGADSINSYAAALCDPEEGFALVSDGLLPLANQTTSYSDTHVPGELILARDARSEAAKGRVFMVRLTWADGNCAVELSCPEGKIIHEDMDMQDTVGYLGNLKPSELGLAGDSMDNYRVYPQEGTVLIDGRVYRKFIIYSVDPNTKTNNFEGVYLVDGHKLFRLDQFSNTVTPLN